MAKDKTYISLIHKARWLRLRREILTAHPLCVRCMEDGVITSATEVHHIRPVEEAVSTAEKVRLMFDPSNLRALCHDCHVKTHTELGRCGKDATQQRNKRQLRTIIAKFFGDEGEA